MYCIDLIVKNKSHRINGLHVFGLCRFVAGKMGGAVEKGNLANFSWELAISELKLKHHSNVLPLGSVSVGTFYHRALLFKVRWLVLFYSFILDMRLSYSAHYWSVSCTGC